MIALLLVVITIYISGWFWTISLMVLGIAALYVCMRFIEEHSANTTTPIVKWNRSGWANTPF